MESLEIFTEREQPELLANDIKVLVSELNSKARQAAENGLRVEITVSAALDVKASVTGYPVIRAKVLAQVL